MIIGLLFLWLTVWCCILEIIGQIGLERIFSHCSWSIFHWPTMLIIFCSSYTKGKEKEHTEMPRPKYSLLLMSKIYLKVVYKEENLNRQQLYVCLYTIQLEVSSSEKIQASCFLYALFIVIQQTSALCLPNVGSRAPVDIMA